MIADAMGWTLDRITDEIEPKLAAVTISSEFLAVDPGYVCGIIQDGVGYRKNDAVIRLHMEAYLGAPESATRSTSKARRASPRRLRRHPRRSPPPHRRQLIEKVLNAPRAAHDARPAPVLPRGVSKTGDGLGAHQRPRATT